ncbi:hypothetical protein SAMN05216557_102665 [Sphingomonas carotinifaciens]|uniref:Uncharacterized protein n=1 Tax=Sphingomonas carotinifaciens TaxID=1166323 RepID=A0A1G7JK21_9SPHN|nr:hypothetical protein SAMN05216557_102665 [Sphingomonas carotinifaciens]
MLAIAWSQRRPRLSSYLIEGYWQIANTGVGGIIDRVGNRCGDAGYADLADSVCAHRGMGIGNVGPDHVDFGTSR